MRLEKVVVTALSLVDHPASRRPWTVVRKGAGGDLLINTYFPFEITKSIPGRVSGLAFCRPDEPDAVGDIASAADLQYMAKTWKDSGHALNVMHKPPNLRDDQAVVASSSIQPDGAWSVVVDVHDPEIRAAIAQRRLTGFSLEGRMAAKSLSDDPADLLREARRVAQEAGVDLQRLDEHLERQECARQALSVLWQSGPWNRDWRLPS